MNRMTSFKQLEIPRTAQVHQWQNLNGCASSIAITKLASETDRVFVYVARNSEHAYRINQEIRWFSNGLSILNLRNQEILPYDPFSPQKAITASRLETLYALSGIDKGILIIPIQTLMQRLPPRDYVLSRTLLLKPGHQFYIEKERERLNRVGYRTVSTVYERGEYAVRGSLFDIYPIGTPNPVRIDLFDMEIESLRFFDPKSQRTVEQIEELRILPANEFPLDESSIKQFRNTWHRLFDVDDNTCPVYRDVSEGILPEGVEIYMPLFFPSTSTLSEYLPDDSIFILDDHIREAGEDFWCEIESRYESRRYDQERPVPPPSYLYVNVNSLVSTWNRHSRIQLDTQSAAKQHTVRFTGNMLPDLEARSRSKDPAQRLRQFIHNVNRRVLITAESLGRKEHLIGFLHRTNLWPSEVADFDKFLLSHSDLCISVAPLDRGCWLDEFVIISETQIFGMRHENVRHRTTSRSLDAEQVVRNLSELSLGSSVVHIDHGIGLYRGLQKITHENYPMEFLTLEYADGDILYVPVSSLHLISRYAGPVERTVSLDKLGTDRWTKAKRRAAEKARDVAVELLDIYARRKSSKSFAYPDTDDEYEQFCDKCEFELTSDQSQAVEAVMADLSQDKSSDRLICGDVGFGKTEVAMRAAFQVTQSGKQVAVLVPTTLLARQHYDTFSDRFADCPQRIEYLSRLRSEKEVQAIQQAISSGVIDIVIGTHKLLSQDLKFKDLGLLVIDEEHRFGVRDKERLKSLRASVDILTLTATPIPRTLNMSVGGLRDLSIIATPPADRLSIRTFVVPKTQSIVREAITRELARGGQVFYVHNQVETIQRVADELQKLISQARIEIGHGKMPKRALESTMSNFYHRRCNVLICTTIIESGIDVPNANTIVVDRADRFGLAQLHQLRGRVGRSHRQAYAYLLKPQADLITEDAQKRLQAIEAAGELGIGFSLALHDLEIRGAGELLGQEQSGQMEAIGFTLYMEILERTVASLKRGEELNLDDPLPMTHEINIHAPALIPSDYIPDVHMRLILYKRIASADSEEKLDDLRIEMNDRFGLLPEALGTLFRVTRVKLHAARIGIRKINIGQERGYIEFESHARFDLTRLIKIVQSSPSQYRLAGQSKLLVTKSLPSPELRIRYVSDLLNQLTPVASERQVA